MTSGLWFWLNIFDNDNFFNSGEFTETQRAAAKPFEVDRVPGQDTRICFVLVADSSAAVNLQLWGNEVDAFQAGDILRLNAGYFTNFKNSLFLKAGKRGKLEKIGEFTMLFSEAPNMSRLKWNVDPNGNMKPVFNHEEAHGEQYVTG
ncbi:hypothetical protein CYMTET_56510 [Cymbomonas tetramitiformis]|uniref:Uncharacterized protein n=1 Tax=Cymbomonas tetramitiformis TaxID=36881 RepID=A0AAE0BB53_9CHLO|nr:hypothetical protein CYMTET_56510 [Cymbomonas tetramitiformis]